MRLIKLSSIFYNTYSDCDELMKKRGRPYLFLTVLIDDVQFAIPLRHNINHSFCFHTIPPAGLDYSKSVVVADKSFIDADMPHLHPDEWRIIAKNEARIMHGFRMYLRKFRRARRHPDEPQNARLLKYSTLQYFDF